MGRPHGFNIQGHQHCQMVVWICPDAKNFWHLTRQYYRLFDCETYFLVSNDVFLFLRPLLDFKFTLSHFSSSVKTKIFKLYFINFRTSDSYIASWVVSLADVNMYKLCLGELRIDTADILSRNTNLLVSCLTITRWACTLGAECSYVHERG